jgi:predicted nucleotidyltransferase
MQPDVIITEYARKLRGQLGENLRAIILFGSRARGDYREGSDYDCLIILSSKDSEAGEIIDTIGVEFLDKYDVFVVPIICTEDEWSVEEELPLGKVVAMEGIPL